MVVNYWEIQNTFYTKSQKVPFCLPLTLSTCISFCHCISSKASYKFHPVKHWQPDATLVFAFDHSDHTKASLALLSFFRQNLNAILSNENTTIKLPMTHSDTTVLVIQLFL